MFNRNLKTGTTLSLICNWMSFQLIVSSAFFLQTTLAQTHDSIASKERLEVRPGNMLTDSRTGDSVDPLIQFYSPATNSADRFQVLSEGLLIEHFGDVKDRPPWTAGFKIPLMMKGDFKVELDFECEISEVKSGWGQGLVLIVALNDSQATELKVGRFAMPRRGQISQLEVSSHRVSKPTYIGTPTTINEGTLTIERTGTQVAFSVSDSQQTQVIGTIERPLVDLRYVEVICTRQQEGNASAKYLLKKLRLEADSFYSFEGEPNSSWRWWIVALVGQVLIAAVLIWRVIYSR